MTEQTNPTTFTDMLGNEWRPGQQVLVPTTDREGAWRLPKIVLVDVIEVIVREPGTIAPEKSVRVRLSPDDESIAYEPHEVVIVQPSAPF